MDPAKIRLSAKETELVSDADWILTKNGILQKVNALLAAMQPAQQELLAASALPPEIIGTSPKISRGENYKGLPWYVLDYPRLFTQEHVFAIRSFFWWGHFFSVTLQLSGQYKEQFGQKIIDAYSTLAANDFSICIHESEWEHHFESDNYQPIGRLTKESFANSITRHRFIKIAAPIPLSKWEEAGELLISRFAFLLQLLVA
jgi:hypothetical protein